MTRHEFLESLHRLLEPATYLEVGVADGRSLALSHAVSIGVDPAFRITVPIECDVQLARLTSDEFFRQDDPLRHFRGSSHWWSRRDGRSDAAERGSAAADPSPADRASTARGGSPGIDLAFIDGMHLFEFALRDFMNIERLARWTTVVVFDDVLPRNVDEAARDRHTGDWAGDVYKVTEVLERHRPDLVVVPVDTEPTGVLVVFGANPADRILADRYQQIVRTWSAPDPQPVPATVLNRDRAVAPDAFLASNVWHEIARARRAHVPARIGRPALTARLRRAARRAGESRTRSRLPAAPS